MLLTPTSIALRKAFPWAHSIQRMLRAAQPYRFRSSHLMLGSDYGGDRKNSRYHAYCFLIADESPSNWPMERQRIRQKYMSDGRRMSFKRLDDPYRQQALIPFLQAANTLNGHLVGVLIHKGLRNLATSEESLERWAGLLKLNARWNKSAFESMARKAHFFALCIAQWSRPGSDVTWITDQDEFVANERRLDDTQKFAARLTSLYAPHSLGVFAMNSTAIDDGSRAFEDFVAIPDLAAGMLSELCSRLSSLGSWSEMGKYPLDLELISPKSEIIMDWFWFPCLRLRRTCIVIDKLGDKMRVMKLDQLT